MNLTGMNNKGIWLARLLVISMIAILITSADILQSSLPAVDAGSDQTIDEGGTFTSSGSFSDDDSTSWTATVNYGDGSGDLTLALNPDNTFDLSHEYTDGGVYTVTVTVTDDTDDSGTDIAEVTVNNVAPTATLSNGGPVNEGSTTTVSFSNQSDPSSADTTAGFTYSYDFDNDGTFEVTDSSSASETVPASFLADGPATRTVKARIKDKDGGSTDYTTNITVNNVAPIVDAGAGDTIDSGDTFSSSGSFTDPGTDPWTATVDYGDGSGSQPLSLSSKSFNLSHIYNDSGVFDVTVTVSDGDGGSGSDAAVVTVDNVAPVVNAGPNDIIDEGDTFASSGSFSDDDSTSWTATVNYGDGSGDLTLALNSDKTFDLSHNYTDDGVYTVTVTVTDDTNDSGTDTAQVTVNNVAPTATLSNAGPVNEGSTTTVSFSNQFDPSSADTSAGFTYGYDFDNDGTFEIVDSSSASATVPASFLADGPATRTVKARIKDKDGGSTDYTTNITVNNVSPTATLSNNGPVNEGSTALVSFSSQSDPSSADINAGFTYSYDFDNDGTFEIVDTSSASATVPASFLADGPATRTVKARIKDKDGGSTDYTTNITVNNVAPVVNAGPDGTILQGGTFTYNSGSFTDPGDDNWTATVNYGDGSGTNPLTLVGKTFSLSHTYTQLGTFTITVTVSDGDVGGTGTDTVTVTVSNDALVAQNDEYEVDEDDELSVSAPGVLGNDSGPGPLPLTAVLVSPPLSGTLPSLEEDGSFTYQPNPNFNGIDSFTYRAKKGIAQSNVATVTIAVKPVNDPPQALADTYSIMAEQILSVSAPGVLANDVDIDGDALTAHKVSNPDSGSVNLQSNGSFTYTPEVGFTGVVTFTYRAHDGTVFSNITEVEIEVFDGTEPRVEFTGPVESGDTLDVYNQIVCLKAFAEDDIRIDRVRFYWWNPVALQYFDLSIDDEPPFEACIDTTSFPQGFNQVFAKSYDDSGNESARKWIWLYKVADLWRSLLPVVSR